MVSGNTRETIHRPQYVHRATLEFISGVRETEHEWEGSLATQTKGQAQIQAKGQVKGQGKGLGKIRL